MSAFSKYPERRKFAQPPDHAWFLTRIAFYAFVVGFLILLIHFLPEQI